MVMVTVVCLAVICFSSCSDIFKENVETDAVFLGDSLTAWFSDYSKWNQITSLFDNVKNEAVAGFTTFALHGKIIGNQIGSSHVKYIFLMIGANNGFYDIPQNTSSDIEKIIETLHAFSPNAVIYLFSLLPCEEGLASSKTIHNKETNKIISLLDSKVYVEYIDMFSLYLDDAGNLRNDLYIKDTLHLSDLGYSIWHSEIKKLLARNHNFHFLK